MTVLTWNGHAGLPTFAFGFWKWTHTHQFRSALWSNSLSLRDTTTLFSPHADHICLTATVEQDKISWQNFVEGKISKSWGKIQWQHYQEQLSMQSGDKWTAGLVTCLLKLMPGM
jgi:hypothetical protein